MRSTRYWSDPDTERIELSFEALTVQLSFPVDVQICHGVDCAVSGKQLLKPASPTPHLPPIRIQSVAGKGTTVWVSLPAS